MEKEQLLQELRRHAQIGDITESELQAVFYGPGERISSEHKKRFSLNVVNVLYGIGGLIIFAGIVALIVQNWGELPTIARILITLGMAIVLYISSVLFTSKGYNVLAQILFAVSYVFFPLGIGVSLYEFEVEIGIGGVSFILLCLTLLATISYLILKRMAVNALFAIIFGTSTAYAFLTYALSNASRVDGDIYLYLTLVLGLSHGLLGYVMRPSTDTATSRLGALLYTTGSLGVLIPALALGGIWDVLAVFVIVAVFLLSVYVHSRGMLVLGSVFLIAYLFKITAEYFAGSVGWPVALIFIGIATIAIAIGTFKINQKYFKHAGSLRPQEGREEVAG